jgi:signal transduction histidine kinase
MQSWFFILPPLLALLSYAFLLVTVIRQGVRSRLRGFFVLFLLSMAIWSLGSLMMRLNPSRIEFWNKVLLAGGAVTMPLALFGFVQAFLGQRRDRWLWGGLVVAVALGVATAIGWMIDYVRMTSDGQIEFSFGPALPLYATYWIFYVGYACWNLVQAYRHTTDPVVRNRIRYPLIGMAFVLLGGSTNALPALGAFPIDHAANLVNAFLLAYAILRYQLLDITVVIRKGLLYLVPTILIGAGYFLIISLATRLFRVSGGPQILLLSLIVAIVAAVVAQPLRDRAQLWIDRLFFREKYDSSMMLQRLSHTAASELDLHRLTVMILEEAVTTMHIERAAFFLERGEGEGFCLVAQRGLGPSPDLKLRNDHPIVDWLSGHEHALTRQDVDVMPQFKALWGKEKQDLEKLGAEFFIPLKAKGDLVGIMAVGPKLSEATYSQDDQLTLTTLANQVAVAIQNAWFYDQARQEIAERKRAEEALRHLNRNLEMLNRLGQEFSATLDVQQITERVLQEVKDIVGAQGASIWLWDERQEGGLVCRAVSPPDQRRSLLDVRLEPGQGVAGWVAQTGESATVVSVPDDARFFSGIDEQTGFHTTSLLAVPLRARGEVIGVLEVVNKLSGDFSADDTGLVETLAASAAIAIENARLHRELRDYAGQLEQRVRERTAQLQSQYARLEAILRSTTDGIVVTDAGGEILQANPVAQAWLNRTLSPEDATRLQEAVRDLAQQVATEAAGEERPDAMLELKGLDLELRVAPISEPWREHVPRPVQGKPAAVVDIHDVSQFKALDRMKTHFVSNVSHELRTPVTTVKLYAHLMQQQPEKWQEYLGTLAQEADRQARLVENILQISRIDAGRLEMKPCPTALNQLIQSVVASHQALATERGLTLEHRPYLALGEGPVALVDPDRMMQVLNNLVENAIHYTPEGGTVVISTAVREAKGRVWATATVRDTGMGIPAGELPRVFGRFFRGEKPRVMQISGTGLGLAIVKEIVELHGGRVTVESQEGVGSVFTVWLPLHDQGWEVAT